MTHQHPITTEGLPVLRNISKDVVFGGQPPERGVTAALDVLIPLVEFLAHHPQIRPSVAMGHLQVLGGVVATAERHSQASGQEPGAILASVTGLEQQLVRLGKITNTVPCASATSIWLHGDGYHFTGVEGEIAFGESVRVNNNVMLSAVRLLTRVTEGDLTWDDALQHLQEAQEQMKILQSEYNSFRLRDGKTPFRMTVEEFNLGMRDMLGPITVNGTTYGGANAANTEGPATLDVVLGTADEMFVKGYLPGVRPYLPKAGRHRLDAVINAPSVFDVLVTPTGLSLDELATANPKDVAALVDQLPDAYLQSVKTFRKIRSTYASASSAHMVAIKAYLEDLEQKLSRVQLDRMVVQPDSGIGGRSHDATARLTTMRGPSPAEDVLIAAVDLVAASDLVAS